MTFFFSVFDIFNCFSCSSLRGCLIVFYMVIQNLWDSAKGVLRGKRIQIQPYLKSVQFICLVVSDSATPWTAACQASCPSPTPRACSYPCPSSRWCHPTVSSSVVPFSSCLQSCPASGSFLVNQFFAAGGQIIRASASASVLPTNMYVVPYIECGNLLVQSSN